LHTAASWWGWGSSIVQSVAETVAETGSEILTVYKEDLTEFGASVANDAQALLEQVRDPNAVNEISEMVTQSLSTITETITESVGELADVSQGLSSLSESIAVATEYAEQHLASFENWVVDANTVPDNEALEQPIDSEEFREWRKTFDYESKQEELNTILGNNPEILNIYNDLVPEQISSQDFWERYFFNAKRIQENEATKARILEQTKGLELTELDDWGDLDTQADQPVPEPIPVKDPLLQPVPITDDDESPKSEDSTLSKSEAGELPFGELDAAALSPKFAVVTEASTEAKPAVVVEDADWMNWG